MVLICRLAFIFPMYNRRTTVYMMVNGVHAGQCELYHVYPIA